MTGTPRISLVIPLYNEEANVPVLLSELGSVLERIRGFRHEIVLVDDGSTDSTKKLILQAAAVDSRVVALCLSRNFGHQAALSAGLDHTRGDVVIVMDGDLQDDPCAIPELLAQYELGYDVVYAQRRLRKEPWWLRVCYTVFYRFVARIAEVPLPLDAGDFGLMTRVVVDAIRSAPERNRYLRGLRAWAGFRQVGIPVVRTRRHAGKSKYGFLKLTKLALSGIFAFSIVPIRAAALVGAMAVALSTIFGVFALYAKVVLNRSPQGFTAILLAVIFLAGVNLFFLGVIGEYVGRVYGEVKQRPIYLVETLVRGEDSAASRAHATLPEQQLIT